jgi:hypothetical protein
MIFYFGQGASTEIDYRVELRHVEEQHTNSSALVASNGMRLTRLSNVRGRIVVPPCTARQRQLGCQAEARFFFLSKTLG